MRESRFRNFATIVYVESAVENFVDVLTNQFVPCFVSPLHDLDKNENGELKKPHYHVMLLFDSPKLKSQADEIFKLIGGVGCEVIKNGKSYARYLCHLDNADKAQYSIDDVVSLGGAVYSSSIAVTVDKYQMLSEIIDFCSANDVMNYADLLEWSRSNRFEWFKALCDGGTFIVKEYMKSRSWQRKESEEEVVCEDV